MLRDNKRRISKLHVLECIYVYIYMYNNSRLFNFLSNQLQAGVYADFKDRYPGTDRNINNVYIVVKRVQ
jgi:hypothetical protein